ncbi:efflux RND transporter periplasmic adaptor subunit [Acinetobacter sp. MD2(2019)]|uniref:efflux RND transporter periplasmic adaptor subunit n=1 Tax=Acinetobacter sp. MD2(2019) TaxID=2605273 RepID=UPI002D1F8FE0|nr:efflux RND transporter periplasmic adaptor subunit [Acinetobacter sp. MD2(2019)]MEB3755009.1 efflux RND transporter periplasmic adaptor subunit [Acinetobacter sp. MD2(2019)]
MKKTYKFGGMVIAMSVLLVGCSKPTDTEPPSAKSSITVSTITTQAQPIKFIENLPARVSAYRVAEIRPQVGGIVNQVMFEQGSFVKAGQPLFQLNSETIQADVRSNLASLQRAQAEVSRLNTLLKRYAELVAVNAISQQEYNNTEADYRKAQADVNQMQATLARQRLNLKYATVSAPISGVIGQILVTEGALVSQGDSKAMAVVQQIDKVYVDVKQSIGDYEKLKDALQDGQLSGATQPVEILNSQGKPYRATGKILFSDTNVDPDTGDVTIRILANNQNNELLPGMYVRINLRRAQMEHAILVPEQAIQHDVNGKTEVMVVNQKGQAQSKSVQVGQRYENSYVITQGLSAGEKVIVEGIDRIQPDQVLKTKTWSASASDHRQKEQK